MCSWQKVADVLKGDGVVIIPSDSSYGIAALAKNRQAVKRLYQIKGREKGKPSLIIVGSKKQAEQIVKFTPLANKLIKEFWPGGLTLVLEAKDKTLASEIYGSLGSLAIRLPKKRELKWLARSIGPFILPSANFTDQKPPFIKDQIDPNLINLVDYFLNEPTDGNPVSTLVDARGQTAEILREGIISIKKIKAQSVLD